MKCHVQFRVPTLFVLLVLLAGCAAGNRYAYDHIAADTNLRGSGTVAVGTHDQRPYVLDGDKEPQFVGLQRGGYGNTFDVRTGGGKPLADDMTSSIVRTLGQSGFNTSPVLISHTASAQDARSQLLAAGARRSVLLTVQDWKSDVMMRIGLDYDLTLVVFGKDGDVLAETRVRGKKEVLGAAPLLPSDASPIVASAFKSKLEHLFADPAISRALNED